MNKQKFNFKQATRFFLFLNFLISAVNANAIETYGFARIELCTGDVQISKLDKSDTNQSKLGIGDEIKTGKNPDSRCRVSYANGNVIDIGSASTVKFKENQGLVLNQGELIAFAMPSFGQQEHPLALNMGNGVLKLMMGKVFASSEPNKQQISVFNDLVSATWHDNNGEKVLYPGNLVTLASGPVDINQSPRGMEAEISKRVSPEISATNQANQAFKNRDLVTAKRLFTQIQQVFPYNADAAYHLGLLALNEHKVSEAVEQWRKYVEIDPQGAKSKGITKQLTLMKSHSIQDEVKQAIANENKLSSLPPEPNSIAVNPLINKGSEIYSPIGKGLTAFVITDLMKVPGLKVLEREKLQTLIDEIKLSESGELVEKSSRIRADRIMRAEKLMIGDYLIESNKGEQ